MTPEFYRTFGRIGLLSFGGPAAQIAVMHEELVEKHPWLTEKEYLSALSFCMLLPGPEAMQLTSYAGWKVAGVRGGLMAGLLFVVPGALVMLALAALYAVFGNVPLAQALFVGVKAAVVIIVIQALLKVAKRALKTPIAWAIAVASFIGIALLALPFPVIILAAAVVGALSFRAKGAPQIARAEGAQFGNGAATGAFIKTVGLWLAIWWAPIGVLWAMGATKLVAIGLFFSKLAVVTFGGAYAVLAYMAQDVVTQKNWLSPEAMMDGLGLAETTPGPLILVTEFVGFQAGFNAAGLGLGLLAALVALWATFVPCFLWIFAGAPFIDALTQKPRLNAALSGITAAVVGVILNLSIWFALHVFFATLQSTTWGPLQFLAPDLASLDWRAAVLAVLAAVLLLRFKWGLATTLALMAMGGLLLSQL